MRARAERERSEGAQGVAFFLLWFPSFRVPSPLICGSRASVRSRNRKKGSSRFFDAERERFEVKQNSPFLDLVLSPKNKNNTLHTKNFRCPFGQDKSGCPKEVTSWVVDMSEYVKSIDRNHLTTVGEEGELVIFFRVCRG